MHRNRECRSGTMASVSVPMAAPTDETLAGVPKHKLRGARRSLPLHAAPCLLTCGVASAGALAARADPANRGTAATLGFAQRGVSDRTRFWRQARLAPARTSTSTARCSASRTPASPRWPPPGRRDRACAVAQLGARRSMLVRSLVVRAIGSAPLALLSGSERAAPLCLRVGPARSHTPAPARPGCTPRASLLV